MDAFGALSCLIGYILPTAEIVDLETAKEVSAAHLPHAFRNGSPSEAILSSDFGLTFLITAAEGRGEQTIGSDTEAWVPARC